MQAVISFFKQSAKRSQVWKESIDFISISSLCETKWVDRHDSVLKFTTHLIELSKALSQIMKWKDTNSSSKALTLVYSIKQGEFIIALLCLADILKFTLPFSKQLQNKSIDLMDASAAVKDTQSVLEETRKYSDLYFKTIFEQAQKLAAELDTDIKLPRLVDRQKHRNNPALASAEEYFRVTVFCTVYDEILSDMSLRFSKNCLQSFDLRLLLPKVIVKLESNKLKNRMEVVYLRSSQKILLSLPVSVATAETSFSTLRRTKTWLRSRILEDRLNCLCLLHIHRDIVPSTEKVIERFGKSKRRRLQIIL
ncbi:hypothetical protein RN001_003406 [Aquatica leii]|uniref:HAT C-terminal dimerisation domain-containing protein n=1 Tax=Aquatica leii TaxID=1421715 RepID=A0AAN7QBN8_9COLE|nr:hypothetical protein RN001_003406 [Aquatica leii]